MQADNGREALLNEAADIAMGGWHSVEAGRAFANRVTDYILSQPQRAETDAPGAWDHISEEWRWNLHTFLDVAAGEGYVFGGVDAAALFEAVFPEEYRAAISGSAKGKGEDHGE